MEPITTYEPMVPIEGDLRLKDIIRITAQINRAKGHRSSLDRADFKELMTCLALMHTEVSEATQVLKRLGNRKEGAKALDTMDAFADFGEELADALIRICDCAELAGIDLQESVRTKLRKNNDRPYKYGTRYEHRY